MVILEKENNKSPPQAIFFENNKNLTRFLSGFWRIKKTYVKIRSPKILKGGFISITPVVSVGRKNEGGDSI